MSVLFPLMLLGLGVSEAQAGPRPPDVGSATSDLFPIKVHWQTPAQEALALDVLGYAELSWQVQVVELGFRAPQLPDSEDGPELDIYLWNLGDGSAWASPEQWTDAVPGDGYASVPAYMVIDAALPSAQVGPYTAHEFNHVLHWSMDFREPSLPIWEAVATASQAWTLGEAGGWDNEVPTFQEIPWAPAIVGDSYEIYYASGLGYYYEYGASLWVMHLDEVIGIGDGTAGALLWNAAANEGDINDPDAWDAFVAVSGGDDGQAMNDLARTRWLVGDQWDARGLAAAELWTPEFQVPATQLVLDDVVLDHAIDPALRITGQGFHEVDVTDLAGSVQLSVGSASGLRSGLLVLTWAHDGTVGEVQAAGFSPQLDVDVADLARLMVAVSNLGPDGYDGDDDAYVNGDQHLVMSHALPETPTPQTTGTTVTDTSTATSVGPDSSGCGCSNSRASQVPLWTMLLLCLGWRRTR